MYVIDMPLSNSYQIIVQNGLLDNIDDEIKKVYNNKNIYIITDERVANFYLEKVKNALSLHCQQVRLRWRRFCIAQRSCLISASFRLFL